MPSKTSRRASFASSTVQIQMQNFRDALLLHRHAVKNVGCFHRAAAVRDNDELRFAAELMKVTCKTFHVPVIERRVNFVEHAKRCRPDLQNGKIQRDGNKRLFSAG